MMEVVFFDAAGTLLRVRGSVGLIYSRIAARYDVVRDPIEVEHAFGAAFHARSLDGCISPGSNGIPAEKAWWMDVVRMVFGADMCPVVLAAYFEEVFEVFRSAEAWELYEDTLPCLDRLRNRGIRLAVISNFDSRLYDLLANLGIDTYFEQIILSWHVGAAKPDPRIFQYGLQAMHVDATRAVHIGDSLHEDAIGAGAAGLKTVLLDREGKNAGWTSGLRIESLQDLLR